jgi:DUF971 family protein
MTLKDFLIRIGLETNSADFSKANSALSGLHKSILSLVGAALSGAKYIAALSTAQDAAEINNLSQVLGVSSEKAQELAYATSKTGVNVRDLTELAAELGENIGEAAGGTGEAADAFKSLGIKLKDSKGNLRDTSEVFLEIADKMAVMRDGTKQTGALTGLFGEQGIKLIDILNQGSGAIKALGQEAHDLGIIMSESQVKQGAEAAKQWETFLAILNALKASIAGPVIAQLNLLAKSALEWWKVNKGITKQRLDKVFKGLSAALKPLLYLFGVLAKVLGFVIDNASGLAAVLSTVLISAILLNIGGLRTLIVSYLAAGKAATVAGWAAARAWLAANAPLIAIALLFAAIVLFAQDLYGWIKGDRSLLGELLGDWDKFIKKFTDPVQSGDPWWLKAIKVALQSARDLIAEFKKLNPAESKYNPFKSENWDWDGIGVVQSITGAATASPFVGGAVSPMASASKAKSVLPEVKRRPEVSNPVFNLNVQIDGTKSPEENGKAVIDAVDKYVKGQLQQLVEGF